MLVKSRAVNNKDETINNLISNKASKVVFSHLIGVKILLSQTSWTGFSTTKQELHTMFWLKKNSVKVWWGRCLKWKQFGVQQCNWRSYYPYGSCIRFWNGHDVFTETAQYKQHRCNAIETSDEGSLHTTYENPETKENNELIQTQWSIDFICQIWLFITC